MMMRRLLMIFALSLMAAAACSVGGTESIPSSSAPQASTPAAVEPTRTVESESSPAQEAAADTTSPEPTTEAPAEVEAPPVFPIPLGPTDQISLSVEDGVEPARPIVSWDPIAGAERYELLVRTATGELYWGWQGTATTIPIGGSPQLGPNSAGPALAPGMTWSVVAVGADGFPIAQSPLMSR